MGTVDEETQPDERTGRQAEGSEPWWAELPPGGDLAGVLDGLDVEELKGPALAAAIVAVRRQTASLRAVERQLHHQLRQVRIDEDAALGITPSRWGRYAADELSLEIVVTSKAARKQIDQAARLMRRPRVLAAQRAGKIDEWKADLIVELLDDPEILPRIAFLVETALLGSASTKHTGQLRRLAEQMFAELDPGWADRRRADKLKRQRVEVRNGPHGTASLSARNLQRSDAHQLFERLRADAQILKGAGDERTLHQIMVALLMRRAMGTDDDDDSDVEADHNDGSAEAGDGGGEDDWDAAPWPEESSEAFDDDDGDDGDGGTVNDVGTDDGPVGGGANGSSGGDGPDGGGCHGRDGPDGSCHGLSGSGGASGADRPRGRDGPNGGGGHSPDGGGCHGPDGAFGANGSRRRDGPAGRGCYGLGKPGGASDADGPRGRDGPGNGYHGRDGPGGTGRGGVGGHSGSGGGVPDRGGGPGAGCGSGVNIHRVSGDGEGSGGDRTSRDSDRDGPDGMSRPEAPSACFDDDAVGNDDEPPPWHPARDRTRWINPADARPFPTVRPGRDHCGGPD